MTETGLRKGEKGVRRQQKAVSVSRVPQHGDESISSIVPSDERPWSLTRSRLPILQRRVKHNWPDQNGNPRAREAHGGIKERRR